jgi:RNA polymerase sigma-70 factor (ECF subfamily)
MVDGVSDWKQLMVASLAGDQMAYKRLLQSLYPAIQRYLFRKLGALAAEEDFVQECLLAVHRARHTYDSQRPFEPWLYTVCKYKAIELLRKRQIQWKREILDDEIVATKVSPDSKNNNDDLKSTMQEALEKLPPEMKRAVVLTKIEGLSTEEAAAQEGVSSQALRTRVSRAYKLLRKDLERDVDH